VNEKNRVFLDFFNDKTSDIWAQGLMDLYEQVPFDGISLDMNEPATVCNGECPNGLPVNSTQTSKRNL
jgi:alpha-glucosidase (family GH31 glycosyl hydrolase)